MSDARRGDRGRLWIDDRMTGVMQRMMSMGLVPGVPVEVVRVAPLGDPIMIDVGGYQVSLRRAEARGLYLGSDPDDVGRSTAESVA